MSKQSDAKLCQGYVAKLVLKTCSACIHRKFDTALPVWMEQDNARSRKFGQVERYGDYNRVEVSQRCGIGGFAVKKTATCNVFCVSPD